MHQNAFGGRALSGPAGMSLQRSPRLLSWIKGEGGEESGKGKGGGEGNGRGIGKKAMGEPPMSEVR